MQLADVWGYLDTDVKRLMRTVAPGAERVNTRRLLGAMAQFPGDRVVSRILRETFREADLRLPAPEEFAEDSEPVPEGMDFSPSVHETLNFFRLHRIRPVGVAQFARRLLEIGTGETVRALEEKGMLATTIKDLEQAS